MGCVRVSGAPDGSRTGIGKRLTRCFRVFKVASVWHEKAAKTLKCFVSRKRAQHNNVNTTDEERAFTTKLLFSRRMMYVLGSRRRRRCGSSRSSLLTHIPVHKICVARRPFYDLSMSCSTSPQRKYTPASCVFIKLGFP